MISSPATAVIVLLAAASGKSPGWAIRIGSCLESLNGDQMGFRKSERSIQMSLSIIGVVVDLMPSAMSGGSSCKAESVLVCWHECFLCSKPALVETMSL